MENKTYEQRLIEKVNLLGRPNPNDLISRKELIEKIGELRESYKEKYYKMNDPYFQGKANLCN